MKPKRIILLLVMLQMLGSGFAFAQMKFTVTVQFPANVDQNNLTIFYDNGREEIALKPELNGGKVTISDTYYSKFASIGFNMPASDPMRPHYKSFFIADKPAQIVFASAKAHESPFGNFTLKNAYDMDRMGAEKMKAYISEVENDFFNFLSANQNKLGTSDSLVAILFQKSTLMSEKKAEFVKQNSALYYSFWLFRKELAQNKLLNVDSLTAVFNTVFPAKWKQSAEGTSVAKSLRGRNIKKGQQVPEFSAIDFTGKTFTNKDFQGKYLLINFWASWCKPCLEEMPVITNVQDSYSKDKLEVLYISLDKDLAVSMKTLERYGMKGVHIKGNADLVATFGAQAIPVVYLIDPDGKVVYSRDEENDPHLKILPDILKTGLKINSRTMPKSP